MAQVTFKAIGSVDTYKIEPAPLVTYTKQYEVTEDGSQLDGSIKITLNGTILPNRGNPTSTGWVVSADIPTDELLTTEDTKFESIISKQAYLEEAFRAKYGGDDPQDENSQAHLSWGIGGGKTISAYVALESLDFAEDQWVERADYTAVFTTNKFTYGGFSNETRPMVDSFGEYNAHNLIGATEDIDVEELNDGTGDWQLTRTISATARYNPGAANDLEPWERAKAWCDNRLGAGADSYSLDLDEIDLATSFIENLAALTPISRKRSEQVGRLSGTYSITETWLLANTTTSALATIEWSISEEMIGPTPRISPTSIEHLNATGVTAPKTRLTISGTVTGRNDDASVEQAYANAVTIFKSDVYDETNADPWLKAREQATGMRNLVVVATTWIIDKQTISNNKKAGSISFSFSAVIDTDLSGSTNFRTMEYSVSENIDESVVAVIPIPGRLGGPLVQDLATTNAMQRSVVAKFVIKATAVPTAAMATADKMNTWKIEAITILKSSTGIGILDVRPGGNQGTDWVVRRQNHTYDSASCVYTLNTTFLIVSSSDSFPSNAGSDWTS